MRTRMLSNSVSSRAKPKIPLTNSLAPANHISSKTPFDLNTKILDSPLPKLQQQQHHPHSTQSTCHPQRSCASLRARPLSGPQAPSAKLYLARRGQPLPCRAPSPAATASAPAQSSQRTRMAKTPRLLLRMARRALKSSLLGRRFSIEL